MARRKTRVKANIPATESKSDRFVRVVTPRVGKALKVIMQIGYCAGASYEYTPQQSKQIINVLKEAVVKLENELAREKKTEAGFTFRE